MLTVFRNGMLVNNETTSNDISVHFSVYKHATRLERMRKKV